MLTSFIKNLRSWSLHFINTFAMGLENVFVAFFNLNGITFHSKNLVLMTTTIIQTSSSAILICQKPNCRSKVENHEDFPSCVNTSSIKGMGKESCLVQAFKGQQSPQNLLLPSFFTRNMSLQAYSNMFLCIFPNCITACIYRFTSTSSQKDNLPRIILQGGNPYVCIVCFPILQMPNSPLCQAKMLGIKQLMSFNPNPRQMNCYRFPSQSANQGTHSFNITIPISLCTMPQKVSQSITQYIVSPTQWNCGEQYYAQRTIISPTFQLTPSLSPYQQESKHQILSFSFVFYSPIPLA